MKAEYVRALIEAHCKADRKRFQQTALAIAANEAKLWGGSFASEIRRMVDAASAEGLTQLPRGGSGQDTVAVRPHTHRLEDLVLSEPVLTGLRELLTEHRHADQLQAHGCHPAYKVLFDGPPGTGKTSAAGAVAAALDVPFVVAKQHELIDSHMGDSDKAIAKLFDFAAFNRAVVLIDEFDAIGTARGGEGSSAGKAMNCIVTTLLQMLDRHTGPGVVVAATNRPDALDSAIRRRFDLAVTFGPPTEEQRRELIRRTLGVADGPYHGSHAEIVRDCLREKKRRVIAAVVGEAVPVATPVTRAQPAVASRTMFDAEDDV